MSWSEFGLPVRVVVFSKRKKNEMGHEVPLSEVCACYARLPGDESGMVVCWVCEMTVVQVFDDGIGPELVRSCMRLVRDQEEEERAAMTVVRNQEEETA